MYVAFFEDNYIFVGNFNTSSQLYQPVRWNCKNKIWGTKGLRDRRPTVEKDKYPIT